MANDEIGSLKVSLSLDDTDFNRPLKSVDRNLKALGGELATIRNKGAEWGKSLDGLKSKQEVLGRTLSTQETKVKNLREAYEKSVREKGADAAATENLAAKLNRAVAEYTRTETELSQVNSTLSAQQEELRHTESAWGRMESALDSASTGLSNAGEKMTDIGGKLTVGVTTPILGLGAAALKTASDFDEAQGKMQAQLGLTEEEAATLTDTATNLWKNAFGESIGGVAEDLSLIKRNMKGITGDELESVAESAYILQDAFGAELVDTTKVAQNMMTNFGISANEAFDLMTRGFQEGGDYSGELLDTLNEYSPQFSTMGHSAKDMMNILIAGSEAGAFSLDKVGDAVKEFNIRAKDGSDATAEGFEAIGLSAEDMGNAIAAGGDKGKQAFDATIMALAAMEDPVQRTAAGVALFGTQWEDLETDVIAAMGSTLDQLGEVEGATQKAGDALYDNLGSRATSVFRDFQEDLLPVGEELLDLAEEYLPKVAERVGEVTEAFADMSPEARETALKIAGVAAAAGPALVVVGTLSSGLGAITKVGSTLAGTLGRAGGAGLIGRIGLMGMGGPVGLAVGGIGLLGAGLYALSEASEESKNVNLEHAESMIVQQQELEGLIGKYETLQEKNKLSNEELLLFRDIQADMDTATSAAEVAELAAQADELQKKSGMSNTELETMLGLNDELIERVPEAGTAFSEQGEKILKNTDDLHAANNALRENLELELEIQRTKAEAKLDEDIQARIEAQKELNQIIREVNNEKITQAAKEHQLAELLKAQQDAYAAGQDEIALGMDDMILTLEQEIGMNKANVGILAEEVGEKQKALEKSTQQITKTQELYNEFINLQLASAGINAEGEEGIAQLDSAIKKSVSRVAELQRAKEEQGGLNAEQQEELTNLNEALGIYHSTKSEIQNIQGEQGVVNQKIDEGTAKAGEMSDILSASEIKEMKFTGDGFHEAKIISDEASRDVQKEVDVTDYGKANSIHDEAEKDAHKSVFVKVVKTVGNIIGGIGNILGFAHGTDSHMGGLAVVGDGVGSNAGPELISLPGGKRFLSPDKPTIMDLPRGTSVLSATKTRKILGAVPRYASGTPNMKDYELVDYEARLNLTTVGSTINRVREIRAAEMASLEKQISLLKQEGATLDQLNQAKEKEARLSTLQAEKSREFENRIMQQGVIIKKLKQAFDAKKISLADYNTRVAEATSELHSLKAEQLAFTDSLSEAQRQAFEEAAELAVETARKAGDAFYDMAEAQRNAYDTVMDAQIRDLEDKNQTSKNLFGEETTAFLDELDRQRDAALASFDAQTKAQESAINNQIANINRRRDAEIAAIDAQLAALDEKEKAESREETEGVWKSEQEKLNRRLTVAAFMEDENTVKSVQQELADLEKSMSKQRLEWEREDKRQSLSLEKDRINESYDQQETALENSLRLMQEQRELERSSLEARYDVREEQYEAMRAQQLAALEKELEANMKAVEEEADLQRRRFAELQEQLAIHVENGNLTLKQANEAWLQAIVDTGNDQVLLEIENQNKSTGALKRYVGEYLSIGKSYGNNMIDGVIGTMNARLSEVQMAASKIRMAMAVSTSMATNGKSYYDGVIANAVPMASGSSQPINIHMDGEEIAAYTFNHATGAMRVYSRKG